MTNPTELLPCERWPGYDEQSWSERFAELDRQYRAMLDRFIAFVTDVRSAAPAPVASVEVERPALCRNALRDAGKPYPRSGCAVCRNGGLVGCPYENRAQSTTPARAVSREEVAKVIDPGAWKVDSDGYLVEQVHSGAALAKADAIIALIGGGK